jgi:hypothetical protein
MFHLGSSMKEQPLQTRADGLSVRDIIANDPVYEAFLVLGIIVWNYRLWLWS